MGEILTKVLVVALVVFVVCYKAKGPIDRGKHNRRVLETRTSGQSEQSRPLGVRGQKN